MKVTKKWLEDSVAYWDIAEDYLLWLKEDEIPDELKHEVLTLQNAYRAAHEKYDKLRKRFNV